MAMRLSSERGMTMVELLVSSAVMMSYWRQHDGHDQVEHDVHAAAGGPGRPQQRRGVGGPADPVAAAIVGISATAVYCQSIFPDPDGNNVFDSVRVSADWNPRDGDLLDPTRTCSSWSPTACSGSVSRPTRRSCRSATASQSLSFTYTNQNGGALANPVGRPDLIGGVNVTIVTTAGRGHPAVTSTSAISVRRIK